MTFSLAKDIENAASRLGITARKLESGLVADTWKNARRKYFEGGTPGEKASIYVDQAWSRVRKFPICGPLYLIVTHDDCHGLAGFVVDSTEDLHSILGETSDYAFAVTGPSLEYLIWYDDNGVLSGAGLARQWIEAEKQP